MEWPRQQIFKIARLRLRSLEVPNAFPITVDARVIIFNSNSVIGESFIVEISSVGECTKD